VEKPFTAEAVERSAQSFWDAEAGKVVSPTDALVDHTLDADPDYDFTALALLNPDRTTQAVVSVVPVRPGASGTTYARQAVQTHVHMVAVATHFTGIQQARISSLFRISSMSPQRYSAAIMEQAAR
jgi:hypothetical protein